MVTILNDKSGIFTEKGPEEEQYVPNYECDLHCHTNRSDGNDSPLEFILKARDLNMKAVAITDHDRIPPLFIEDDNGKKIPSIIFAKENNIDLVLGYEFSCDTNIDDVHIIGYECDW